MSEVVCPERAQRIASVLKAPPRAVLMVMGRAFARMPQMSRYGIVSVMALALDASVFLALTHSGVTSAAAAGVVGYVVGLLLHYTLSSRFVFDAARSAKSGLRLFTEFAASGVVGMFLTWAVIGFVVDMLGFWPVVGKAFAVVASFTVVYALRRWVVFVEKDEPAAA